MPGIHPLVVGAVTVRYEGTLRETRLYRGVTAARFRGRPHTEIPGLHAVAPALSRSAGYAR